MYFILFYCKTYNVQFTFMIIYIYNLHYIPILFRLQINYKKYN